MSNIMSLMFSFMLIFPTILFGSDLYAISSIKTLLETRATALCYEISMQGGVREDLINSLALEGITLTCVEPCTIVSIGAKVSFVITKMYTPIIFNDEEMQISVTRTTIVGYL